MGMKQVYVRMVNTLSHALNNKPYDEVSVAAQVSKHFLSIKMHLNGL